MKKTFDLYLLEDAQGNDFVSTAPSHWPTFKTIGISKSVEIEFEEHDNSTEVEKRKADINQKIEKLKEELEGL